MWDVYACELPLSVLCTNMEGAWLAAAERAGATPLRASARARWIVARALDAAAEHKRDNALLGRAITAFLELLKMNERLSDKKLLEITERTINRIQFRGETCYFITISFIVILPLFI